MIGGLACADFLVLWSLWVGFLLCICLLLVFAGLLWVIVIFNSVGQVFWFGFCVLFCLSFWYMLRWLVGCECCLPCVGFDGFARLF